MNVYVVLSSEKVIYGIYKSFFKAEELRNKLNKRSNENEFYINCEYVNIDD